MSERNVVGYMRQVPCCFFDEAPPPKAFPLREIFPHPLRALGQHEIDVLGGERHDGEDAVELRVGDAFGEEIAVGGDEDATAYLPSERLGEPLFVEAGFAGPYGAGLGVAREALAAFVMLEPGAGQLHGIAIGAAGRDDRTAGDDVPGGALAGDGVAGPFDEGVSGHCEIPRPYRNSGLKMIPPAQCAQARRQSVRQRGLGQLLDPSASSDMAGRATV